MLIFTSRDVNVTEATANGHLALIMRTHTYISMAVIVPKKLKVEEIECILSGFFATL